MSVNNSMKVGGMNIVPIALKNSIRVRTNLIELMIVMIS